jgi:hypothetical protein
MTDTTIPAATEPQPPVAAPVPTESWLNQIEAKLEGFESDVAIEIKALIAQFRAKL